MSDLAFPFTVRGFKKGQLLLETRHRTAASRDIEVAAWRSRMRRGDVSHLEVVDHDKGVTRLIWEARDE